MLKSYAYEGAQATKPGQREDAVFQQHWSVAYWRARNSADPDAYALARGLKMKGLGLA